MSERDASTREVVWGKFHHNAISRQHADVILSHATTEVTQHFVTIFQLHSELRVWQGFLHHTIHGNCIGICATWSGRIGSSGRLGNTRSSSTFLLLISLLGQMPLLIVMHKKGPGRTPAVRTLPTALPTDYQL